MDVFFSSMLSIVAVVFTALSYYRQYIYKKDSLELTICDYTIKEGVLSMVVLFINTGNQVATIANCHISLYPNNNSFTSDRNNDFHSLTSPFSLSGRDQKSQTLSLRLPKKNESFTIKICIKSVNSKGVRFTDSFEVGDVVFNEATNNIVHIQYIQYRLFQTRTLGEIKI